MNLLSKLLYSLTRGSPDALKDTPVGTLLPLPHQWPPDLYLKETGKQRRVRKVTPARKRKAVTALSEGVSPTVAAKAIGVSRTTLYDCATKTQSFLLPGLRRGSR